jgi:hypothetical protein
MDGLLSTEMTGTAKSLFDFLALDNARRNVLRSTYITMNSVAISSIVLAVVFGGALFGMFLRTLLPQNHLSDNSKGVVMVAMGLVATMTALVLGLLISSAKNSFDTLSSEIIGTSSKVILLDRLLANYGQDTKEARDLLRNIVADALDRIEREKSADPMHSIIPSAEIDRLYDKIHGLLPKDDRQGSLRAEALGILREVRQTRWLIYEQQSASIPLPVLILLVSWLTVLFISFGLYAPANGTVIVSLLASAVSVSGAIFLIVELYTPHYALVKLSGATLRTAFTQLGN